MESKFRITAGLAEVKTMNGKEFQWQKYDADSIRGPSELEKYLYDKILRIDEDEKPRSSYVGRARIREEITCDMSQLLVDPLRHASIFLFLLTS